jgi:hypothetical protein
MTARYLEIVEKRRTFVAAVSSLADFSLRDGGEIDAEIVLSAQNLSPYCLDDDARRIIFVELPPDVNLATVPFIYQTQYEQAIRLLAIPYDTFREVAHKLPEVHNLILMYISGRSVFIGDIGASVLSPSSSPSSSP